MKKLSNIKKAGATVATLAAVIGLTSTASAIPLVFLEGPPGVVGQAFQGGGIIIKATNHDTGTLYNNLAVGQARGFGVGQAGKGATDANVGAGETTLNGLPGRPAINALNSEDSWGIIKIDNILATASNGVQYSVYNSVASSFELTAVFWGVKDFYLEQVALGSGLPGGGQVIGGTGLRVDIWSDPKGPAGGADFNQTAGPILRPSPSMYPTASDGTLELSLLSTPGFINANGTFGGVATEFQSNTASVGNAALNVIGGTPETVAQFDTNAVGFSGSTGSQFQPGLVTATTDVFFSFTAEQGNSGWDIQSNDPIVANIRGVPDAGSTLVLFAGGILGLLAVAQRRRRQNA